MNKAEVLVLSTHLSLESIDENSGDRVIVNTLTGQRSRMTQESMKILKVFRTPCTLSDAAKSLGISSYDGVETLRSIVLPLMDACFLVRESDAVRNE